MHTDFLPIESNRFTSVSQDIWGRLFSHIGEIRQAKRNFIDLGAGYPDVPPSQNYLQALQKYSKEHDAFEYPGYALDQTFVHALTKWYAENFQVSLPDNAILPLAGSNEGIAFISQTFLDPGDEVLIPDPGYPTYTAATHLADAKPVYFSVSHTQKKPIDLEKLESKITKKTKLLWLNFPNNPTGLILETSTLKALVALAKKYNFVIAYDNAYVDLVFQQKRAPSILEIEGALSVAVELGSFSKSWSLAGYRIGYLVGNPEIVRRVARIKAQYDFGLPVHLQKFAAHVLTNPDRAWQKQTLEIYNDRKTQLASILPIIGVTADEPTSGLYYWAEIPTSSPSSEAFVHYLLDTFHLFVYPGILFGPTSDRFVRITYCRSFSLHDMLEENVER